MIKIYHDKEKSIGIIFLLFERMKSVTDYREFETESSKVNYLNETRRDLLLYNLEYLVRLSGQRSLELEKHAQTRIGDFINYSFENLNKLKKIFELYSSVDKFVVTLSNTEKDNPEKIKAIHACLKEEALNALKDLE